MAKPAPVLSTHVALLRGINLGGNKLVKMSALCEVAGSIGCRAPRTLLNSGNLLFCASPATTAAALEKKLFAATAKTLGVEAQVFVRTAAEWREVIAANPFRAEAKRDPGRLLVLALDAEPAAADVRALQTAITGPERVRVVGRHAYVFFADGQGQSKLSTAMIDRFLKAKGTGRNWNTVLKIAMGLVQPSDSR
jgi:uncharacterized protein (DUF1697 family)